MNEDQKSPAPKSRHERILTIATVVIGVIVVLGFFMAWPPKYAVMPSILVVLVLFGRFLHAKKKIQQPSNHMAQARERRRKEKERR